MIVLIFLSLQTGCRIKVLGEHVVESFKGLEDANNGIADVAEASANGDTAKLKQLVVERRQRAVDNGKHADKIRAENNQSWWSSLFASTFEFVKENGGVLLEAGKNILTQNWPGLATTAMAGVAYYIEKKKKQQYASVINEVAHEPDEKKRHEKLRVTFGSKRKSDSV